MPDLSPIQRAAAEAGGSSLLTGYAGTGKTTALRHRLLHLLQGGESAYTVLVLVAEPEHREGFLSFIRESGAGPYPELSITAYNRMAQHMVGLFWPLIAREAGFARPFQPPTFLSYDMAQLLMWQTVTPLLQEGAFANLRLRPQQIVSQLLDTLNRAALNGLSLDEAVERQLATWGGEPERHHQLEDAAAVVRAFRRYCLDNSLLDLSLVVEAFDTQLVQHPEFHRYFRERYRHLIVDNIEEQTPAGQNFVERLMLETQTTAIALDTGGGYKRFLAADPQGAEAFRLRCEQVFTFEENFVAPEATTRLANLVQNKLLHTDLPVAGAAAAVVSQVGGRYRREMIQDLALQLHALASEGGVAPRDMAIVVPYLDGALRYMLTNALRDVGLPYRLLRRRTSPREEPRVRAWLTWLALAHPLWDVHPAPYDVAEALSLSIHGLDPARAQLLTDHLYQADVPALLAVDFLPEKVAERVGPDALALVDDIRLWLAANSNRETIDQFLHSLFNDLLAQPQFQPEPDIAGAAVLDWLVRSAGRMRRAAPAMGMYTQAEIGAAFIDAVNQGLVTANPPDWGDPPDPDGITIATIYAYLLAGEPARVQVWLETAAQGWWDIPRQPLSNAFVLAQSRPPDLVWETDEEFAIRNELLSRIARGLANRTRDGIILASSDLDRRGVRQQGALWQALALVRNSEAA